MRFRFPPAFGRVKVNRLTFNAVNIRSEHNRSLLALDDVSVQNSDEAL